MLQQVDIGDLSLGLYERILPDEIAELREVARALKGARVLHISSTPYGGGVSELLRSLVPLERALGIDSSWEVMLADQSFFRVTKMIHNALQGAPYHLSVADKEVYMAYSTRNAQLLPDDYDFIMVHDPQPAALRYLRADMKACWIWRCHIDTSSPNPAVWRFLKTFIKHYHAKIFTLPEFVPRDLNGTVHTIMPAIDPLSPKNMDLPRDMAKLLLNWIGIPDNGPLICQVSRFDPWKDPMGVIEAYRLVKKERPDVRLALVGSMALDDPEGWDMYEQILEADRQDAHIHVFTNLVGVGDLQVNAFQRLSKVIIQKSIREGFGLVISETLWKETPVVARRAGGISAQMAGGGGFLTETVEDTAAKVLELLNNPSLAQEEGRRGRRYVQDNFLITRLIRDQLELLNSLS